MRLRRRGVEAYKVNVKSMRGNLRTTIQYNPLFVAPLANSSCGQAQRAIVNRMLVYWTHLFDQGFLSWIGCCFYPAGTKAYMYGGVRDEDGDSWSWGDLAIKGVQMDSCDWGQPMQIASSGPEENSEQNTVARCHRSSSRVVRARDRGKERDDDGYRQIW